MKSILLIIIFKSLFATDNNVDTCYKLVSIDSIQFEGFYILIFKKNNKNFKVTSEKLTEFNSNYSLLKVSECYSFTLRISSYIPCKKFGTKALVIPNLGGGYSVEDSGGKVKDLLEKGEYYYHCENIFGIYYTK